MSAVQDWVRPWFPAGLVGHVDAECPELLKQVPEPVEGPGWLNPYSASVQGTVNCGVCVPSWDAECLICDASMAEEWEDDGVLTEEQAKRWKREHCCQPIVHLIPPDKTRKKST